MRYLNITAPDISNGVGCRVTLWISGCFHQCKGCHNPHTWNYEQGKYVTDETIEEIGKWLEKPYIKGLTISGGDPLANSIFVMGELENFCKKIKERFPDKDIWIYTGYVYENLREDQLKVLQYCDVLVDGPYKEELRDLTLPFRGSSNQRIIYLHQKEAE